MDEAIKRLNNLFKEGNQLLLSQKQGDFGPYIDGTGFYKWNASCLSAIERYFGGNSTQFKNFEKTINKTYPATSVEYCIGILKAAMEDIENGYLIKYQNLISAEIFSDYLEMAKHLLENDYGQPAASLTGATLEDGLRKICVNNEITLKDKEDISSLNKKLADGGIYNRLEQKKIQVLERSTR